MARLHQALLLLEEAPGKLRVLKIEIGPARCLLGGREAQHLGLRLVDAREAGSGILEVDGVGDVIHQRLEQIALGSQGGLGLPALGDVVDADEHFCPGVRVAGRQRHAHRNAAPLAPQRVIDVFGFEGGFAARQREQFLLEGDQGFRTQDLRKAREQLCLAFRPVQFQRGAVNVCDSHQLRALGNGFGMCLEMGREIRHPRQAQIIDVSPDGGEILLPDGDGRVFEQGPKTRLAAAQLGRALGDAGFKIGVDAGELGIPLEQLLGGQVQALFEHPAIRIELPIGVVDRPQEARWFFGEGDGLIRKPPELPFQQAVQRIHYRSERVVMVMVWLCSSQRADGLKGEISP